MCRINGHIFTKENYEPPVIVKSNNSMFTSNAIKENIYYIEKTAYSLSNVAKPTLKNSKN